MVTYRDNNASRAEYSPPFQGGVDGPPRNIPVPLKGADGAVVKVAQPPNRRSRSAPNSKERFAALTYSTAPSAPLRRLRDICLMAQPPRLAKAGNSALNVC